MPKRLLTAAIVFTGLAALDTAVWFVLRNGRVNFSIAGADAALAAHAALALAAAVVAAGLIRTPRLSTRITLAVFFLIIAAALPVLGIVSVGLLAGIFALPSNGGQRAEDRFCFGNPRTAGARRESRKADPELRPLAEAMRLLDTERLAGLIEGLRHLGPPRLTLPLIRRFQQDSQAGLQFAAQGLLSSNIEDLEFRIGTLRERATAAPADIEPRLAGAECCLQLMEWSGAGDAAAAVFLRDAGRFLEEAARIDPQSVRLIELRARVELAGRNAGAALDTARNLRAATSDSRQARLLEAEALFAGGDWSALHACAAALPDAPAEYRDCLAFWSGPRPA